MTSTAMMTMTMMTPQGIPTLLVDDPYEYMVHRLTAYRPAQSGPKDGSGAGSWWAVQGLEPPTSSV